MSVVRSVLYTLVFYLGSAGFSAAAALMALRGPAHALAVPRAWARFHHWCARVLLGIRVRVEGVLPQSGAIVALKHQSFFETTEVLRLFDRPAVVFKAELLKIPAWGYAATVHGVIPVEREAGGAALRRMLKAARAAVAEGRPIVIFPEGTRTTPGVAPPLRPGIAGLYKSLDLPIVPVSLDTGRLWPKRGFVKRAGLVTFRVGETIPPGLPREEVERLVHARINALGA